MGQMMGQKLDSLKKCKNPLKFHDFSGFLERVPTFEPAAQEAGRRRLQSIGMTGFFNIYPQRTTRLIRLWRLYFFVFLGSI